MFDLFRRPRPQTSLLTDTPLPCTLFISLCNTRADSPHLLRLSPEGGVAALSLPGRDVRGVTGMVRDGDGWILAVQMPRGGALARLGADGALIGPCVVPGFDDAHGLAMLDDRLHAVATGDNRLIALDGAFAVHDRLSPFDEAGSDLHHINDICVHRGRLVFSAFGARTDNALRNGGLFTLDEEGRAVRLFGGLNDPHSVTSDGESLYVLDSRTGDLYRIGANSHEKVLGVQGYARGLYLSSTHIVVGVSAQRSKSRSTALTAPGRLYPDTASADAARRCGLYVHERRTGRSHFVDLSAYGPEIYQISAG